MELINAAIEAYAEKYTEPHDALLQEVYDFTVQHHPKAHMLSGPLQGAFLTMLSRLLQPRRVLEIGTFTGYSALCLAKGLAADGQLHTIELRPEDAATAQRFFTKSPYSNQIKLHIGAALFIIAELNEVWDFIFIDADKVSYIDYFNLVLPKLRAGGLILADNVFFHGEVLNTPIAGKNAKAIQAFNDQVLASTAVEKVMLPLRDGLYLLRKL